MNQIPRIPNELEKLYAEARMVRNAIRAYGGSFMKALGNAMDYADRYNLAKIRDAWPKEWAQYLSMYDKMVERMEKEKANDQGDTKD